MSYQTYIEDNILPLQQLPSLEKRQELNKNTVRHYSLLKHIFLLGVHRYLAVT